MLIVKLFGSGQAHYFGKNLAGFPNQQPTLLLCYLLLNKGYPHSREQLSAVFWNDCPTHVARKSLRNSLWRLRQIIQTAGAPADEYLLVNEDSVSFINSSLYWLDSEIFEKITALYQEIPGEELTREQAERLEDALDLYSGDLLESVYEDWVLYERERLGISYINNLSKLMIHYGMTGNYERGLACGERILTRDNTREKVHRQMMWLYFLLGDRNSALAQYKRCCQILLEELGIEPMEETRQLFEQITYNQFRPQAWAGEKVPSRLASPAGQPSPDSVKQMMNRLHYLQMKLDEASTELRILEKMMRDSMGNIE
ncbi:MAG: hypothetical protein EHM70_10095 [Chloroflexota bacterium]|nr:MAG: hypothetical protein EHM70_10095 [Chloroflexota bacterium]